LRFGGGRNLVLKVAQRGVSKDSAGLDGAN
jgi:hypothetical protein